MTPIDFIHRNVISELIKQGYAEMVAHQCANRAVDHYRCCSATKKGGMFDDCLNMAKAWATKLQPNKKSK